MLDKKRGHYIELSRNVFGGGSLPELSRNVIVKVSVDQRVNKLLMVLKKYNFNALYNNLVESGISYFMFQITILIGSPLFISVSYSTNNDIETAYNLCKDTKDNRNTTTSRCQSYV